MNREFKRKLRKIIIKLTLIGQKIFPKIKNLFQEHPQPSPEIINQQHSSEQKGLKDLTVIITGSSRGIGCVLAKEFLKAGSSVMLNGRYEQTVSQVYNRLKSISSKLDYVVSDVATSEGATKLIERTVDKFKGVDILINNAASLGPPGKKMWELTDQEWQGTLDVNLSGPFYCSRQAIAWALKNNAKLRIINVSSGIVNRGAKNLGIYNTTKTGLDGLTISIDEDTEDDQISVVSIKPRSVRTEMTKGYYPSTEYGMLDDPETIAPVFLYAATAPSAEIKGKSFDEPAFALNPQAEIALGAPLSYIQGGEFKPIVYQLKPDQERKGIFMHFLQNPFGYYPSVKKAIEEHLSKVESYQYPDPQYTALRTALSQDLGIPPADITFGNGSSEIIERAIRTFGGARRQIIITRPTWGSVVWPAFFKYGLQPIEVPCLGSLAGRDVRHDLNGIFNSINYQTKLIYLVNPCNPTGSVIDKDELKDFLYKVPSHVTVLLDEAYIDFCEPDQRFHLEKEYQKIPCRVIGIRTFSKFFALSGFRVGFAYGNREAIDFLNRLLLMFNISTISQVAAVAAWKDKGYQEKTFNNNKREKEKIYKAFQELEIDYQPTQTNFVVFDCPLDRNKMRHDLIQKGFYLPNLDLVLSSLTSNAAALTVGLPEHNDEILAYLKKF